jgi:integrase
MAVRERKTKDGISYDVATYFNKKQFWEHAGKDKREAQRLDAKRKREIKDGTYSPRAPGTKGTPTVVGFIERWGNARTNVSADDDRRNLARFLKVPEFAGMHIDDVRARHVIGALNALKGTVKLKTLQNAYGTLRTMFRDARIEELTSVDPCVLPRGFFNGDATVERQPYSRTEAALLVAHAQIPEPLRVLNALCLLAGLRKGEACGRRWRDLDMAAEPLWAMAVGDQYDGRVLKTKRPRSVPVHPELAAILKSWGEVGFSQLMGRKPEDDDFIVPLPRTARHGDSHHTASTYYKAFVRACAAAKVRARSLHSMRHTMITLARRGGARKDVLEKVTHNARGDIVDRYTHLDWAPLCEAVAAIGSLFAAPPSPRLPGVSSSDPVLPAKPEVTAEHTKQRPEEGRTRLQFPAPPLPNQHDLSHFANPDQSPDQCVPAIVDDPSRSANGEGMACHRSGLGGELMLPWLIAYGVGALLFAVLFGFVQERARQEAEGRLPALSPREIKTEVDQLPPPWVAFAWPMFVLVGLGWAIFAGPGWFGTWLARRAG